MIRTCNIKIQQNMHMIWNIICIQRKKWVIFALRTLTVMDNIVMEKNNNKLLLQLCITHFFQVNQSLGWRGKFSWPRSLGWTAALQHCVAENFEFTQKHNTDLLVWICTGCWSKAWKSPSISCHGTVTIYLDENTHRQCKWNTEVNL